MSLLTAWGNNSVCAGVSFSLSVRVKLTEQGLAAHAGAHRGHTQHTSTAGGLAGISHQLVRQCRPAGSRGQHRAAERLHRPGSPWGFIAPDGPGKGGQCALVNILHWMIPANADHSCFMQMKTLLFEVAAFAQGRCFWLGLDWDGSCLDYLSLVDFNFQAWKIYYNYFWKFPAMIWEALASFPLMTLCKLFFFQSSSSVYIE